MGWIIRVQAKRYSSDHKVVTSEVDQFATVMGKQGVKKGVFIITSDFVNRARNEYSKCFDNKTIRLISHCLQNKQSVKFSINSAFFIEMCYNKCKKIIKSNKKACT